MRYLTSIFIIVLVVGLMAACHKGKNNNNKGKNNGKGQPTLIERSHNHTPPDLSKGTIVGVASQKQNLSKLVSALKKSGKTRKLTDGGPFTLFAPTNKAFMAIPKDKRTVLLTQKKKKLARILMYHVVKGTLKKSDFKNGQTLKTVNGKKLKVTRKNGSIMINGAKIISANIKASNGTIFIINKVLMPSKTANQ
jgi:uncharacterized surface protein with fasciclin (FAS1) repeats